MSREPVGTAPRGGEDITHLEKPSPPIWLSDPKLRGYEVLGKRSSLRASESRQAAGCALIKRLMLRTHDRKPASGLAIPEAKMVANREWESHSQLRHSSDLRRL